MEASRSCIQPAHGASCAGYQEVLLEELWLGVMVASCKCAYMIIAGHSKGKLWYCRAGKAVKNRPAEKQPFSFCVSEKQGNRQ